MGESKHAMSGSEFGVLKGHSFPDRRYVESDCEGFFITVETRSNESALKAAKHVALALNSHDDLLEACEAAFHFLNIFYENDFGKANRELVIESLEEVIKAAKGDQ